ncbi:MAG: metallophosphoesterase [Deltaproteobacteria bacterium]|nr:metallophosphoesterase [Deltaproteobacteria bacterium]
MTLTPAPTLRTLAALLPVLLVLVPACGGGFAGDDADAGADAIDAEPDDGAADDAEPEIDAAPEFEAEAEAEAEIEEEADAADAEAEAEVTDARLFSFAQITDLHIGEGADDYGTPGWDDRDGPEDDVTATLRFAVSKINFAIDDYDIRFVMVTGDLGDSGERSEEQKAKDILDQLNVPYFPLIGNHDIWPYSGSDEASGPVGDAQFEEVFSDQFALLQTLFPSLEKAPTPVYNPECSCMASFQNYAFDYEGYHFVALDLVTRSHAPLGYHGVTSEADLFDFEGGTWRWLTGHLDAYTGFGEDNVFFFSHHPPIVTSLGILDCLTIDEVNRIDGYIRDHALGGSIWGFFAGHHHLDYTLPGYDGQTIVVTPAEKDGSTARVIQLYGDHRVDVATFL